MEFLTKIGEFVWDQAPKFIGGIIVAYFTYFAGKRITKNKEAKESTLSVPLNALPAWSVNDYLNDLVRRASTLSFGDPASWSVASEGGKGGAITLDQIWTPLRVADSQSRVGKVGTHENMAEEDKGIGLPQLFESTTQSLLILGDPGSGKSTSLAYLSVDAARKRLKDDKSLLPIWINLAAVSPGQKSDPENMLLGGVQEIEQTTARNGRQGGIELGRYLRSAIVDGKALLLLDGLDEVKDHALDEVRRAIGYVVGLKNGTRVVATCRKFDYRQSTPSRKIPIERELELLSYDSEEQATYVERWYDAAVLVGRFSRTQATELGAALIGELRSPDLATLGESPLLLALLTLIHSEEAKLPDTRAVLCDRAITYMLADSAKWRIREAGSSTIAIPPVLSLATEVAYRSHLAEEAAGGTRRGVTAELVHEAAAKICDEMARAEPEKVAPSPSDLAGRFLNSHGLLLDSGSGTYKFSHRSFQEFLAGQRYAAGAHPAEAISRGGSVHWREAFKLMASFAGHEGNNLYYILSLIRALLAVQGPAALSSIQLGAEMLTEIGRRRLALRQFKDELTETLGANGEPGLWARARSIISAHVENASLALPDRERSAAVVGLLGDPRLIPLMGAAGPWTNLIPVAAGSATVGSKRLDEGVVSKSGGFWGTPRVLEFGPMSIGRYLVTNVEFRAFVDDDGYTNQDYWVGKFASGWMSGDGEVLRIIRENWLKTVNEHHAKEIRDGEIDVRALEQEATSRTAPRQAPYYWHDRRFNQPNQPVVGINWWEAAAYCVWATRKGHALGQLDPGHVYTLPTEFEWEFASRPASDDRVFPWGDDWSEDRAHVSTNKLNMRQPAPVGVYLEPWPGGPCDLAGNVWEWTASLFHPFGEEFDGHRLSSDSLEERVVRGSSWYNSSAVAACSARAVDRSYNLFYDVGFRIVSLPRDAKRAGHS